MLDYENANDILKKLVNTKHIKCLKYIVTNYKILYKNVQGNTKFLDEVGLYILILKSGKKKAEVITDWITNDVMPSIRKTGEYKLNHKLKKEIDRLNEELEGKKERSNI